MKNKQNDGELYGEMYGKLFREFSKTKDELIAMAAKLENLQCELEEFYINEGKTDMYLHIRFSLYTFYNHRRERRPPRYA